MASRAEPFITESLEWVRQRPGMYMGGTGIDGLHNLAFEVIGNSIDQVLQRQATSISVDLSDGWLTVGDNGVGISVESVDGGTSFLESVFTRLHGSPTRDGPRRHVHVTAGLTGVGLGPVSALCRRVEVESHRDGLCHRAAFSRGEVSEPLTLVGPTQRQGLRVRLSPEPGVFEAAAFEAERLETAIRRFAYLMPEVSWRFQGHDASKPDGLLSFLTETANGPLEPGSFGVFEGQIDDVEISFAIALRKRGRRKKVAPITSWVNLSSTDNGGSHVNGMVAGLTDTFGAHWRVLEPRVVGALHLVLAHPRFEGPTKARLAVPMTEPLVRRFVAAELAKESDLRVTWRQVLFQLDP
jgi:DNA gyrase subunit B